MHVVGSDHVLVHQSLPGLPPAYLADGINFVADSGRSLLRSGYCVVPRIRVTPLATGSSLQSVRGCGRIYRLSCDKISAIQRTTEDISVRD